jgi:hypothetical protein
MSPSSPNTSPQDNNRVGGTHFRTGFVQWHFSEAL